MIIIIINPLRLILHMVFQELALAAKQAMSGQLEAIKIRYEEAVELRRKAELEIEAFRPVRFDLLYSMLHLR